MTGGRRLEHFGQKILALRRKRQLTQKKLAALSGVSPSYLSRVERGQRQIPHPSLLSKLAAPLQVSEYELLFMAGYISGDCADDKPIPGHWQELVADPSLDEAVRGLEPLSPQEKQSLYCYLQAIRLQRNQDKNTKK
jgi:transcriptional regulator with XRE-family HTH domain